MEVFVEKFDTIENIKSSILKLCIKINKNIQGGNLCVKKFIDLILIVLKINKL